MTTQATIFESERANLAHSRLEQRDLASVHPGQVLVRVAHFALTANNITYGVAGDSIGYWRFFPAEGEWGRIPVWGFGDVIESAHPDVAAGTRIYGYFPMGTHVVLEPANVSAHGFADGAAHRADLPAVYNQYVIAATDPAYQADREAEQMLYRPLFTTSFLLDDWLADNDFFGASQVILTSASSKTSIGLAHLLFERGDGGPKVVGLTSAGNRAFVEGLGCYHQVLTYDDAGALSSEPAVLVDMAGSGRVRATVHEALGAALQFSSAVGATHWEDSTVGAGQDDLPGPKPSMFFAPSQAQKRIGEWGREGFEARLADAWTGFLEAAASWIEVERCEGPEALQAVYDSFIAGKADPAKGYVVAL